MRDHKQRVYSRANENCEAFPDADSAANVTWLSFLSTAASGGSVPCLTVIHKASADDRLVLCPMREVTGMFFGSSYSFVSYHTMNNKDH